MPFTNQILICEMGKNSFNIASHNLYDMPGLAPRMDVLL